MNSVTSGSKKPALCRYFVSNGSCFYGNDCQFVHAPSAAPLKPTLADISSDQTAEDCLDSIVTNNRLDSLFMAFSQQNGLPQESKLAAYLNRPLNSTVSQSEKPAYNSSSNSTENSLNSSFATLSLDTSNNKTAPNPGANEFIPRSTTPANSSISQRTNSPTFPNYNINVTSSGSTSFGRLQQGGSKFNSSTSPLQSPRLTPTQSPLLKRRNSPNLCPLTSSGIASSETFASPVPTYQENVGGTTYYYTHNDGFPSEPGVVLPNFHAYPTTPAHIAHMNPKANAPSFFMPDELRMDILHRHSLLMAHVDPEQYPDLPSEVDSYHNLVPLEPLPTNALEKSRSFGYVTSVFKATNLKTGLIYCLRRIHGFRLANTKCMALVDMWKKLQHSNIVQTREVFTTKAFGEHSIVFVHDYYPGAETMMARHFSTNPATTTPNSQISNAEPLARSLQNKVATGPRQHAGLLPESLIWCYIVQLSSALRTIHAAGLACRSLEPSKILITGKSRLRLNCCSIFDVLAYDPNQTNPLAVIPHYQQEDLVALGKIVLALACNSTSGIQREHVHTSMELIARNYSADLRNLILYLLTSQNRIRSVNDIMPMIGARFYTQLDAAQMRSDVIENELAKEVENGRLLRLLTKLGIINERPELNLDPSWSETGDRYMLKLFRDYLFHPVTEQGHPWIDMAHIVQCLNKLEAGVPEKVCLMSRDEQNILVVSYSELKHCFETSFNDITQAAQQTKSTS